MITWLCCNCVSEEASSGIPIHVEYDSQAGRNYMFIINENARQRFERHIGPLSTNLSMNCKGASEEGSSAAVSICGRETMNPAEGSCPSSMFLALLDAAVRMAKILTQDWNHHRRN